MGLKRMRSDREARKRRRLGLCTRVSHAFAIVQWTCSGNCMTSCLSCTTIRKHPVSRSAQLSCALTNSQPDWVAYAPFYLEGVRVVDTEYRLVQLFYFRPARPAGWLLHDVHSTVSRHYAASHRSALVLEVLCLVGQALGMMLSVVSYLRPVSCVGRYLVPPPRRSCVRRRTPFLPLDKHLLARHFEFTDSCRSPRHSNFRLGYVAAS